MIGNETYTLAVAALENDITLTFDEETTSKTHVFSYGKSMEFEFTSENTASLDVSVPKGWTYTADVDAGLLTVTAPTQEEADPAMEGSVKVTPLSVRGTAGEGASIPVELSTKLPGRLFVECERDVVFQSGYGERIGLRAACLRLYFDDHVAAGLGSQVGGWGGGDRTAPRAGDHGAFPACGRGGHRVGDECTL